MVQEKRVCVEGEIERWGKKEYDDKASEQHNNGCIWIEDMWVFCRIVVTFKYETILNMKVVLKGSKPTEFGGDF